MEEQINFENLTRETKTLTGLSPAYEALLIEVGPEIKPHLTEVTDSFYEMLQTLPKAQPFLQERVDALKQTHLNWLESLFIGPFDENYAKAMYHVGEVHVRIKLPVEFMQGAGTIILSELIAVVGHVYASDSEKQTEVIRALNSVIGFSVTVMQESYQASSLAEELGKFLAITGMSRTLFNNLAFAYEGK